MSLPAPDRHPDGRRQTHRESIRLTDADIPNSVLVRLDESWAQRAELTAMVPMSVQTSFMPAGLAAAERQAREHLAITAMAQGRALLSCTVSWRQRSPLNGLDANDPDGGLPWAPGEPVHPDAFVLACVAKGLALPQLDVPTSCVPPLALFVFRCGTPGCVYTQHGSTRVAELRAHPLMGAQLDPTPLRSVDLTPAKSCPGSGQLAQGFDVAAAQAFEDDPPLYLFRCGTTGCEHTQHSIISTMTIREHTVDGVRCTGSGVTNTAGADLSRRQR